MADLAQLLDQLMDYLNAHQADPATYLLIFFLFSIAAAVVLPIPVEIGLIWNPGVFFPLKAITLGLGKSVGSVAVFYIGTFVDKLFSWLGRFGPLRRLKALTARFANRLGMDKWRVYKRLASRRPEPPMPGLRWGWLRWLARKSEGFVRRFGVLAIYILMSIPGMVDTVPLYVFAILNKQGTLMTLRDFALANLLAGVNRAFIIFAILELLGVRLFG